MGKHIAAWFTANRGLAVRVDFERYGEYANGKHRAELIPVRFSYRVLHPESPAYRAIAGDIFMSDGSRKTFFVPKKIVGGPWVFPVEWDVSNPFYSSLMEAINNE